MLVLRRTICYNKNSLKSAGLSSLRRLQQRSVDPTAIVYGIIGLNISVYGVWQYAQSDSKLLRFMYNNFTTSTSHVLKNGKFHTVITSVFSHNDGWHIAANMISLYFFGLETAMILGASRFLALYLCGGTISSIAYILWPFYVPRNWPAKFQPSRYASALGASGAINAVVMYSILSFPTRLVYVYMVVPVPAAIFGGFYILNDVYGLYYGNSTTGNAAHLGGAAFGALYFLARRFGRR